MTRVTHSSTDSRPDDRPKTDTHIAYVSEPPTITAESIEGDANYIPPTFPIGPFKKHAANPILKPNPDNAWEAAHLFNAAAIVLDAKVFLFYRAQNHEGLSSIGLAWSDDGISFTRLDRPILTATEPWEEGGGCEDPRVMRYEGTVYMTYSSYGMGRVRLCMCTSTNLVDWKKYEPMFPTWAEVEIGIDGRLGIRNDWTKAGAIFPEKDRDGKFNMLWGDDDLIKWETKSYGDHFAHGIHSWENRLLEAGLSPIKTKDGKWLFIYNAATTGGGKYKNNQYSVGQMLVDYDNLAGGPLARLEKPLLEVSEGNEQEGQVGNVVFCEGLVQFKAFEESEPSKYTRRFACHHNKSELWACVSSAIILIGGEDDLPNPSIGSAQRRIIPELRQDARIRAVPELV
ncbi:uncharacterized protein AB675_60 [Cyphellophora attinorum]|uniref:Glycosyl hydrolase family 32 N-terminal domain-containing protein n=1 Tax=Cyphellophora attinorum TaxID=1664694 RepID=A0A0N1GX69_9EURO|nr:uncharacterized protein AB675_60 [Phialophora attinorum]KPI34670.1 hypothetical protein AB675_60 [Phialophora attinorum]